MSDQYSNPNFSMGYPDGGKPSSTVVKSRTASYYFNLNYGYDMRYLVDLNLRTDGASVFGINNPFSTWVSRIRSLSTSTPPTIMGKVSCIIVV